MLRKKAFFLKERHFKNLRPPHSERGPPILWWGLGGAAGPPIQNTLLKALERLTHRHKENRDHHCELDQEIKQFINATGFVYFIEYSGIITNIINYYNKSTVHTISNVSIFEPLKHAQLEINNDDKWVASWN